MPRLSDRHAEILDGYMLHIDTEATVNEITAGGIRRAVKRYLLWLQTQNLHADPLGDDPAARDSAVGFYKRELFAQAQKPAAINAALAVLRAFYTWWGPGPHQVPSLTTRPPQ